MEKKPKKAFKKAKVFKRMYVLTHFGFTDNWKKKLENIDEKAELLKDGN